MTNGRAKKSVRVILVGNPDPIHVGAHLLNAALEAGHEVKLLNSEEAFAAAPLVAKFNWWARGRRPARLREFSRQVVSACRDIRADVVVTTGISPVDEAALRGLEEAGVRTVNCLTDDPWNPHHRAPWFFSALRRYDRVFSPRRSNIADLEAHGVASVRYLPFAYAPAVHFSELDLDTGTADRFSADVVFAGGADPDRVPCIAALIREGFRVALYGGYWGRHPETRSHDKGHADPRTVRMAIAGAEVALCLVRRANRDGHSMRTFEIAAMGACVLAEYTDEHREILGEDGEAVVYFRSEQEMIDRLRWLLDHPEERQRLRAAVRGRVTGGRNTYRDRLETMLAAVTQ